MPVLLSRTGDRMERSCSSVCIRHGRALGAQISIGKEGDSGQEVGENDL
jgi:hypothetical protein